MAISDDTLRNLAGERDRLTASPAIDARRVMADVSQISEMAVELLRYRAAERMAIISEADRQTLLRFLEVQGANFPITCAAVRRVLDGLP